MVNGFIGWNPQEADSHLFMKGKCASMQSDRFRFVEKTSAGQWLFCNSILQGSKATSHATELRATANSANSVLFLDNSTCLPAHVVL